MDIVEKLREAVGSPPEIARQFMSEAADEIEALRNALLPFACEADAWEGSYAEDNTRLFAKDEDGEVGEIPVTVGHLRRARTVLNK